MRAYRMEFTCGGCGRASVAYLRQDEINGPCFCTGCGKEVRGDIDDIEVCEE
jgi:transcription elongation factor Elf1